MKIGLVCRRFVFNGGGLEKYTIDLSRSLMELRHEVHVFAAEWNDIPGVVFHRVPIIPFSSPVKNLSFGMMAAKISGQVALDVLQSMERIWQQDIFRASDGINPVQMLQKYPNPWVRRFKSAGPRRRILALLENRIFLKGGCRFVVTNSRLVRNQITAYYNVPPEKIHVIYNSVDRNRFSPENRADSRRKIRNRHGIDPQKRIVFFAGNNFRLKGLQMLFEAVAVLGQKDVCVMVAGGDPVKVYEKRLEKLGIRDQVIFLGRVSDPEHYYRAADIFVLPTRYDAFANVCLEALACGTPVITTQSNGAAEIIKDDMTGYVLKTWEARELAYRLKVFMTRDDRKWMSEQAASAAARFTSERSMDRLIQLYHHVREAKRG